MTPEKIKAALEAVTVIREFEGTSDFQPKMLGAFIWGHDEDPGEVYETIVSVLKRALLEAQTSAGEEIEGLSEAVTTITDSNKPTIHKNKWHPLSKVLEAARRYAASQQTRGEGADNKFFWEIFYSELGSWKDDAFMIRVEQAVIKALAYTKRADKPADNGGDIEALKRELNKEFVPCFDDTNAVLRDRHNTDGYIQHTAEIIDYLASRNLLKSEGVCVPGDDPIPDLDKHLVQINIAIDTAAFYDIRDSHHNDLVPAIKTVLKAANRYRLQQSGTDLRPFLPAEK